MITKRFEKWLAEEVEEAFGYVRQENLPILDKWLGNLPDTELDPHVAKIQKLLVQYVDSWNEDELKMMFIAPLLLEVQFNYYPHYKVFTQRFSQLKTENVDSQGRIEWMVATGRQTPKKPFFFLQEYKPEKNSGNDPLGQLLMAMAYAQKENAQEVPLYGSYVLGRLWFFVVMEGKNYAISRAFDATQIDDLKAMIAILQRVKTYIHQTLHLETI